jgi:hypothetical protein
MMMRCFLYCFINLIYISLLYWGCSQCLRCEQRQWWRHFANGHVPEAT